MPLGLGVSISVQTIALLAITGGMLVTLVVFFRFSRTGLAKLLSTSMRGAAMTCSFRDAPAAAERLLPVWKAMARRLLDDM